MKKQEPSLLAKLFSTDTEERREEIVTHAFEDTLKEELDSVGLYVYSSVYGLVIVASDGAPERAYTAIKEVLRFLGAEESSWKAGEGSTIEVQYEVPDEY